MQPERNLLTATCLVFYALLVTPGCGPSAEDQARLDRINQRNRQGPEAQFHRSKQSFDLAVQEFQAARSAGDGATAQSALNRILSQRNMAVEQCIAVIEGDRNLNALSIPGEISPAEREADLMLATGILKIVGPGAQSAIPVLEQLLADETQPARVREGATAALESIKNPEGRSEDID